MNVKYRAVITEDKKLLERLRRVLNDEYLKRSLIKYFVEKGYDHFKRPVYPPVLQDLPFRIPELANKIEVVPYVQEINPATGQVTTGWNLFVLGTERMSLGESTHENMSDFQRAIFGPTPHSVYANEKSPEAVIEFVMKVLSNSKHGIIRPQTTILPTNSPASVVNRPKMGPTQAGSYYERSRPVN